MSKEQKPKKQKSARFQVIADYRRGEKFPETPEQFAGDFRLLRQLVRWAKRYGVLRDGRLHIYVSKHDMERNHVWRTIDLARSVVSYRSADNKFVINTTEPSPEIFRLKLDKDKFKLWLNQLRAHRQYGQAKLVPMPKVVPVMARPAAQPSVIAPSSPVTDQKGDEASTALTSLTCLLDKMEETFNIGSSRTSDVQNMQREFLGQAREALSKFHELLGIAGGDQLRLKKWQSCKVKRQIAPTTAASTSTSPTKPQATSQEKPGKAPSDRKAAPKSVSSPERKVSIATPTPISTPVPTPIPTPISSAPPSPVSSKVDSGGSDQSTPTPASTPISSFPTSTGSSGRTTPPSSEVDEISAGEAEQDNLPNVDSERSDERSKEEEPPSPAKVPVYRRKLPAPMGPQPSIFRIAMAAIGRDVMQFSLPAAIMEPLSMLQILCEELEYSELIDLAVSTSEPQTRMAYVACFAISRYGSTAHRSGRKPFNPLLGQTFEFDSPHLGWRFIAEQVFHHPSVSAGYAEGRGWRWWHDCELMVTFGGSSLEAKPAGVVHLYLDKWKETYKWTKVSSQVSGLLSGTYTLDHYGDMVVRCAETELTAKIHFKKQTKDRRGDVDGKVVDGKGRILETVYGNWSDSLYVGEAKGQCVWRLAALPPEYAKYYGMTKFAMALNENRPDIHGVLPKTDSRYRPDQKALEMGKADNSDMIKKDLEEKQRKRRKDAEAGKRPAHKPLWFQPTGNKDAMKGARWKFNGGYWKAKETEFKNVTFLPLW